MIEKIEKLVAVTTAVCAEIRRDHLPLPWQFSELEKEFNALEQAMGKVISRYRSQDSSTYTDRELEAFLDALTSKANGMPRLEEMVREIDEIDREWGGKPAVQAGEGRLPEQLRPILKACAEQAKPLRYRYIRERVEAASQSEREETAADKDLMSIAGRWMSPANERLGGLPYEIQDFPEFVVALRVKPEKAAKKYPPEAEVDKAVRGTLEIWLRSAVERGVTVVGHVLYTESAYLKAIQRKFTPRPESGVNGFTAEGTIYVCAGGTATAATLVHEAIHLYSHGRFKWLFGGWMDEGVTEYFGRKVMAAMGLTRKDVYEDQLTAATALIGVLGEENVAQLYFYGVEAGLRSAFVKLSKNDSDKAWGEFGARCEDRDWDKARDMLK